MLFQNEGGGGKNSRSLINPPSRQLHGLVLKIARLGFRNLGWDGRG
jgi:hypothetical protein